MGEEREGWGFLFGMTKEAYMGGLVHDSEGWIGVACENWEMMCVYEAGFLDDDGLRRSLYEFNIAICYG